MIVIIIILMTIVVMVLRHLKKNAKYDVQELPLHEKSSIKVNSSNRDNGSQCDVKSSEDNTTIVHEKAPPPRFEVLDVNEDCELREFVEKSGRPFKRGCAFYEFTHDIEDISDGREIVLMKKVVNR